VKDRIFYTLVLTGCTGLGTSLLAWAIRSYIMTSVRILTEAVATVKKDIAEVKKEQKCIKSEMHVITKNLKCELEKLCRERQKACAIHITERIEKLEAHGHSGLKGDENKITL